MREKEAQVSRLWVTSAGVLFGFCGAFLLLFFVKWIYIMVMLVFLQKCKIGLTLEN